MKNTILIVLVAVVLVGLGYGYMGKNMTQLPDKTKAQVDPDTQGRVDAMAEKEAELNADSMKKDGDFMMKKEDDSMMKKEDDSMMKKDVDVMVDTTLTSGSYEAYSQSGANMALANGKKVALFFYASWCPTCRALDDKINTSTIPADVVIMKVDYDNSTELKQKYGVTSQHTVVTIDKNGNMIKKATGSKDVAAIVKLF